MRGIVTRRASVSSASCPERGWLRSRLQGGRGELSARDPELGSRVPHAAELTGPAHPVPWSLKSLQCVLLPWEGSSTNLQAWPPKALARRTAAYGRFRSE